MFCKGLLSWVFVLVIGGVYGSSFPYSTQLLTKVEIDFTKPRSTLNDCVSRYQKYAIKTPSHYGSFGVPTKFKEFSHMAAIGWTEQNDTVQYHCGGSLISENFVLTAGHCTLRESVPPDVVRVGDINLNSNLDDKHAQNIKIFEIIKHPEYKYTSRYNDIALVKLEKSVGVDFVVSPACLFTDDTIEYEQLVATGWGDTGFSQKKSDILLKFRLAPISLTECNESYPSDRYLKQGLKNHQFCAFDAKMDTCSGDSGGPLGVKLATNHRLVPFVVGITSFGSACGYGTPGVYTKVASFIPWIQSVVVISFDPHDCALRNIETREKLPKLPPPISVNWMGKLEHHVYIGSSLSGEDVDWFCSGSLISDDYVVTAASCFEHAKQPDIVELGNIDGGRDRTTIQRIRILRTVKHPKYNSSSTEDNIALIQLQNNVELSSAVYPSCVWSNLSLPDLFNSADTLASGPQHLHDYSANLTSVSDLDITLKIMENEKCSLSTNSYNQICAGISSYYLVPKICNIKDGSVLERMLYRKNIYNFVFGIYSHGKDCGFGKPAVFLKLAAYVKWMESVMFHEQGLNDNIGATSTTIIDTPVSENVKIVFYDEDNTVECATKKGTLGFCLRMFDCHLEQLNVTDIPNISYCNSTTPHEPKRICCPTHLRI